MTWKKERVHFLVTVFFVVIRMSRNMESIVMYQFFLSQVYRDYKSLFFCPIIERFWMLIAWQVKAKYHLVCYQLMHPIAKKCIRLLEVQTTYPLHLIVRSWHDQGHLTSHICIQKDFRAMKNSTLLLPNDGQKEYGPEFMMVPDDCMA